MSFSAGFSWGEYGVVVTHFIFLALINFAESQFVWTLELSNMMQILFLFTPFSVIWFNISSKNQRNVVVLIDLEAAIIASTPLDEKLLQSS